MTRTRIVPGFQGPPEASPCPSDLEALDVLERMRAAELADLRVLFEALNRDESAALDLLLDGHEDDDLARLALFAGMQAEAHDLAMLSSTGGAIRAAGSVMPSPECPRPDSQYLPALPFGPFSPIGGSSAAPGTGPTRLEGPTC